MQQHLRGLQFCSGRISLYFHYSSPLVRRSDYPEILVGHLNLAFCEEQYFWPIISYFNIFFKKPELFLDLFSSCYQISTKGFSPQSFAASGLLNCLLLLKSNICYQISPLLLPDSFLVPPKCSIFNAFRRSIFPGKGLGAGLKVLKAAANKSSFKALPRKI